MTIVVPVYGHLPSLERCLTSVFENVDLSVHRLLIVNDHGPDHAAIEQRILEMLEGHQNTQYFLNEKNLGFVGTCNRAVFELDTSDNDILLLNSDARLTPGSFEEMLAVLHADEKHGIVFPRSNNASIANVPLMPLDELPRSEELTARLHAAIRPELPRWAVTPVAVGFCFLVRRSLIANYGYFDEIYAPGYSEENDFCFRVNRFGYSSVAANHALVFHEGSKSFDERRIALQKRNEVIMLERYPHYYQSVAHFLQYGVDAVDWFADRIYRTSRTRVLIDLYHMSLIYNGSTRNALSFLELLAERQADLDIDFVIVSSREAIEYFSLESYGMEVVPNGELEGTFDLGFALSPVSFPTQLNILNRHCLRWMICHFDIIALRIHSLLEVSYARRQVVLDSLNFANRIVPISHASVADIQSFFGAAARPLGDRAVVVLEGVAEIAFDHNHAESAGRREPGYVLVVGNIFAHKQFPESIAALAGSSRRIVAFGALPASATVPAGVEFIEGGRISDAELDRLYRDAACVVFPSSYEGYGLPLVEAAQRGAPVVLFDMAVGHEVAKDLGIDDRVVFVERLADLPQAVETAIALPDGPTAQLRPLRDYNNELLDLLLKELDSEIDHARLRDRVERLRSHEIYAEVVEKRLGEVSAILASRTVRTAMATWKFLGPIKPVARTVWRGAGAVRRGFRRG